MKAIISLIIVIIAGVAECSAQGDEKKILSRHPDYIDDLPFTEDGKLVFQEVVPADHGQERLYLLSKIFFTKVFKSADAVIQFDDKATATVIGKGFSEITIQSTFPVMTRMYYTITVQSKDKRYKYEISDIYFKSYPTAQYESIETSSEAVFSKKNYYKKNGEARQLQESYHLSMLDGINSLIEQLVEVMNFTKPTDDW